MLKYPCPICVCITNPSVCQLSVRNVCDPSKEGGNQSAMAYHPVISLFAHSLIHLVFSLLRICQWSFARVVISMASLRSVASFANLSALSFPSIPMCPGTHDTSINACLFLSR